MQNIKAIGQAASQALEINDEFIKFVRATSQQGESPDDRNEYLPEGLNEDDLEALKEVEKLDNGTKINTETSKVEAAQDQFPQPSMMMGLHPETNNIGVPAMIPPMEPSY